MSINPIAFFFDFLSLMLHYAPVLAFIGLIGVVVVAVQEYRYQKNAAKYPTYRPH